jgi:predicted MPP superfamily phosphohydrolase
MRTIEFSEVEIEITKGGPELDGLKLAFLSDLHAGSFLGREDLLSLARRVAEWEPDVLCLGGDLIDTRLEELHLYEDALRVLETPLGRFAVPGNHEYYRFEFPPRWAQWLEDSGVRVLWNRGERIQRGESTLWLGGVDDLTEGSPDAQAALVGRAADEPAVMLSHHPDVFQESARLGVDLQISGHTHGGQVRIFGRTPIQHSDHGYLEGLHRSGDAQLYVSRGVGVTAMPFRIGVPGEVVLIRLRISDPAANQA